MASLAADTRIATKGAGKAAISTHPLFPAIVALWFAALLGLGSMILPTALLERLVTVTGLASLVPMAAPPLGFTARVTLALGAGALGALLGLVLARQLMQGNAPRPAGRFDRQAERACRPISAHDELGAEGLGMSGSIRPQPVAQKRRSLAMAEDNTRSDYLLHVPLPGQSADLPLQPSPQEEPLELGEFAAVEASCTDTDQDDDMTDGISFHLPREAADREENRPECADSAPAEEAAGNAADEAGEALHFAAPSLRRQQDMPAFLSAQFELDEGEPVDPFVAPGTFGTPVGQEIRAFDAAPAPQPQLAVVEPEPDLAAAIAAGLDDRPLDDLGLVQLAARLGASIERRRAMRGSAAQAGPRAPVFSAGGVDFDAAAADDAAQARASFFAPQPTDAASAVSQAYEPENDEGESAPPSTAQPLRSLSFDEVDENDEDGDFAASFSLPSRDSSGFAGHDDGDDQEDEDEVEYSSLLAMKNPFQKKAEFIRIDEPEADEDDEFEATVTFPSTAQADEDAGRPFDPPPSANGAARALADAGEAERELREALATLQRMSGAA